MRSPAPARGRSSRPAALLGLVVLAGLLLAEQPASAAGTPRPAGLGPSWAARLAGHNEVVIASGAGWTSPHVTVTEWQRTSTGWVRLGAWSGWSGRGGWTTRPAEVRPQSPVGVFG